MSTETQKDVHRTFVEERELIDTALRQGVRDAILRHKRDGLPMVIFRDGKSVSVRPEDLDVPQFSRRPGAPTLTVEDVDRLAEETGE